MLKSRVRSHASSPGAGSRSRHPHPSARTKNRRWLLVGGMLLLGVGVVALFAFTELDIATVQRSIEGLNPVLIFALMATLPVAGFSVGVMYLVAGAKFGPLLGGALVAAATAIHLLATHWISRSFLRRPLERLLSRRRHHLPEIPPGENGAISVMAALVPGIPYFARNYLLALSGVPLRTYFWICLSIYVARSYVTIFLGDLGSDPDRTKLAVLIAVYALKLGICAYLIARLRRRYKQRRHAKAETAHEDSAHRSFPTAHRAS